MSGWDIALVAVVSIMGTAVAYLHNPQHKAFVLMLPIPFSMATMSVGLPVDATNVIGIGVLGIFSAGTWFLHARLRWPIIPVIVLCGIAYCLIGAGLASILPKSDLAFWLSVGFIGTLSAVLIRFMPHRDEPGHRTPLPIWIKLPAIALVIIGIVTIKKQLGGFMTAFPMVGTIAAYEARNCLWTILRRIPWVMLLILPMHCVIRLTQDHIGVGGALLAGWPVFLLFLWLLRRHYTHIQPIEESFPCVNDASRD